jgi:hypothetical protein
MTTSCEVGPSPIAPTWEHDLSVGTAPEAIIADRPERRHSALTADVRFRGEPLRTGSDPPLKFATAVV